MSGGERHQVVVHVAAETARRLACDASLVAIVEDEKGGPLNVGRKTAAFRRR